MGLKIPLFNKHNNLNDAGPRRWPCFFFNFTKRNNICGQSIYGGRWALEFRQLPTLEFHGLIPFPSSKRTSHRGSQGLWGGYLGAFPHVWGQVPDGWFSMYPVTPIWITGSQVGGLIWPVIPSIHFPRLGENGIRWSELVKALPLNFTVIFSIYPLII